MIYLRHQRPHVVIVSTVSMDTVYVSILKHVQNDKHHLCFVVLSLSCYGLVDNKFAWRICMNNSNESTGQSFCRRRTMKPGAYLMRCDIVIVWLTITRVEIVFRSLIPHKLILQYSGLLSNPSSGSLKCHSNNYATKLAMTCVIESVMDVKGCCRRCLIVQCDFTLLK